MGRKCSESTKEKIRRAHLGKRMSDESRLKMSMAKKGKPSWNKGKKFPEWSKTKNHNWKGGKHITETGYVVVLSPGHPNPKFGSYVYEHRLVMEGHLGRYLKPSEIVHHINGNRSDNRIENLQLFKSHKQHAEFHGNKKRGN